MEIYELEDCKDALELLISWLSDKSQFSKEVSFPIFDGTKGDYILDENPNHLIGEMYAVRGVISGAKSFSGASYLNEINSSNREVTFYQDVIIPVFLKEFPDNLEKVVDGKGDVEFYNPQNEYSMFVKDMLANYSELEKQMDEENRSNKLYSDEYAMSILFGYGKYSTLYYWLRRAAYVAAYQEHPEINDDYDPILLAAYDKQLEWMASQNLSKLEYLYDSTKSIVMRKFREWQTGR